MEAKAGDEPEPHRLQHHVGDNDNDSDSQSSDVLVGPGAHVLDSQSQSFGHDNDQTEMEHAGDNDDAGDGASTRCDNAPPSEFDFELPSDAGEHDGQTFAHDDHSSDFEPPSGADDQAVDSSRDFDLPHPSDSAAIGVPGVGSGDLQSPVECASDGHDDLIDGSESGSSWSETSSDSDPGRYFRPPIDLETGMVSHPDIRLQLMVGPNAPPFQFEGLIWFLPQRRRRCGPGRPHPYNQPTRNDS